MQTFKSDNKKLNLEEVHKHLSFNSLTWWFYLQAKVSWQRSGSGDDWGPCPTDNISIHVQAVPNITTDPYKHSFSGGSV